MNTLRIKIDPGHPIDTQLEAAVRSLQGGELVAFPTETVYGLGANALDETAARRIFEAKRRDPSDPLIVHVSSPLAAREIAANFPPYAEKLADAFWPGPLTLVLPKKPVIPDVVTAGLPTVAVRVPSHPVAAALIRLSGLPVAAPSANLFERPSPTRASHVLADLDGRIAVIVDGGPSDIGVESTIIDASGEAPVLLRPGGVPLEAVERVLGQPVKVHPSVGDKAHGGPVLSPGMNARHYAPRAVMVLVEGGPVAAMAKAMALVRDEAATGRVARVIAGSDAVTAHECDGHVAVDLGGDSDTVAKNLFDAIRRLDEERVDTIIACGVHEAGLGMAVMNRLRRAASRIIFARGDGGTG